jgi:hypothetical protein
MANIKIIGDTAVVVSSLETATIKKLQKFAPEALRLKDTATGEDVFAINFSTKGSADFTPYGITYNTVVDNDKAALCIALPLNLETAEAKKEFVLNAFGKHLLTLNTLEKLISEKGLQKVEEDITKIEENITVL